MKLTYEQWSKLSPEEKREAIINFQEPTNLYRKEDWRDLRKDHVKFE